MFTDSPVTPCRIEILIDVLRDFSRKEWSRSDLISVLQPKGLPDVTPSSDQARQTLAAARELGLLTEDKDTVRLVPVEKGISTREFLLGVLDKKIASATDIEPYYAPFFSYFLQCDDHDSKGRDGEDWAIRFNQECPLVARAGNPFNKTKFTGLVKRWYTYSGHGWEDPSDTFQPNPYGRLKRSLPDIFGRKSRLDIDEFMARLALHCPELDGGSLFMSAAPQYDPKLKKLTLGLSHALVDLHSDNVIQLNCPVDSRGWSIEAAQPPIDGKLMRSSRVDHVEYVR
jgi:hypothetical protein